MLRRTGGVDASMTTSDCDGSTFSSVEFTTVNALKSVVVAMPMPGSGPASPKRT